MKRNQIVAEFVNNISNGPHLNRSSTMSINVGGPLNMLASNKDSSMVVVVGRTILKLYSVDEASFSEKVNMRVGRKQGLNLSCADVSWNPINENLVATAATNGAIITWDLNIPGRNKQMGIFTDHKRTVTKIGFHNSEPGRLLSGSQDCTMKMFDIRKKECVSTFVSKTDGVRCVQFCPHEYFQFAASFDNGSVQIWDYRNTSTFLMQFIAHKGSVYTIEWHPDSRDRQLIATGGRDNKIKIWDNVDNKMNQHVVIPTHSLVAVARWRSQRRDQIASVAMMLDHSINVWDMRRPYVPFARFTEHSDVTTGIVWKKGDPEVLFSCSKDGMLFQHSIHDAHRPSEHCNLSGLSIGSVGHIGYASADCIGSSDSVPHAKSKAILRFGFRNVVGVATGASQSRSDTGLLVQGNQTLNTMSKKLARFLNSKSELNIHSETSVLDGHLDLSPTSLISAAKRYKLQGLSFDALCDYNSLVAKDLGIHHDHYIWLFLKVFFQDITNSAADGDAPLFPASKERRTLKANRENLKSGATNAESIGEESEQHSDGDTEHCLTDIPKPTSEHDYYSEDEDYSDVDFMRGVHDGISPSDEAYTDHGWLPTEAFHQRLVLQENIELDSHNDLANGNEDEKLIAAAPIKIPGDGSVQERRRKKNNRSLNSANHTEYTHSLSPLEQLSVSPIFQLKPHDSPCLSRLCKSQLLQSMFNTMLESRSGIQIVACVTIVLGHYFPSLELPVENQLIEHWQSSYLDLISHYELWNHYTEIVKLSNLPAIRNMNTACVIYTSCVVCGHRMSSSHPWICSKHCDIDHKLAGIETGVKCILCHTLVKELFVWCQGCCHGGHVKCIRKWFSESTSMGQCPTGCGHFCGQLR